MNKQFDCASFAQEAAEAIVNGNLSYVTLNDYLSFVTTEINKLSKPRAMAATGYVVHYLQDHPHAQSSFLISLERSANR